MPRLHCVRPGALSPRAFVEQLERDLALGANAGFADGGGRSVYRLHLSQLGISCTAW